MTIGCPSPHSPSRMNVGLDQVIEKNHVGPLMWTSDSREFTIPNEGWNIHTKMSDDATTGTIDGM
jgi:hypothetical protein